MGIFGRKSESHASTSGFDTWIEPEVKPAESDWERRVNAFARKSAGLLSSAEVPLFRSQWSRDGRGTFNGAFWLVAADVSMANRSWVKFHPGRATRSSPNHPPSAKEGDYVGHLRGTALLLTRPGNLCSADFEGFFTRSGGVDNRSMDMIFSNVRRNSYVLSGSDGWGWYNMGRWRSDPRSNLRVYGVDAHVQSIRFEERYRRAKEPDPGYGTSAALSSFVKGDGATRWPKHFASFDY